VKGFDQPVRGWRVLGWASAEHGRVRLPLVGRAAELRQFESVCRGCSESQTGQLVYLRGEAGIGKTRLVEEFEALALASGFELHKAMALDFGLGRARDAVGQLAASLLDAAASATDDERLSVLEEAIRRKWLQRDELVYAQDLLGVALDQQLRATYDAMDSEARSRGRQVLLGALLTRRSAQRPLLLVVEDIHWAEASVLNALAHAAAITVSTPVVMVLTSRREGDPISPAWRAQAGPAAAMLTIDLAALRLADALKLADGMGFKSDPVAAECVARAEGNPLFLEQLLRGAQSGQTSVVPDSIQSIVLARLDRLPPRERRAAQAASVLGQRFSLPLLRHLLASPQYECTVLVEENLVRPLGEEYLFYHALIWDCIYLSLLRDQKREWHGMAAQWYADKDPALAAEHLDRAQDPGAAQAYLQAARAEKQSYRTDRALALLDRGLDIVQAPQERFELLAERGTQATELGRAAMAIQDFRAALELADQDSDRARAWIGLAAAMRISDQYDEALAALERAQELTSSGDDTALAQIHHLRGNLYFPHGRIEECMREHRLAVEYARRAGSPEWETRTLGGLADALMASGRFASGYRSFEECVQLAQHHGLSKVEAAYLGMQGNTYLYLMRPLQPGIDMCLRAAELARKLGHPRAEIVARHGAIQGYLELDDMVNAMAEAQLSLELARAIRSPRFEGESISFVAWCLGRQGDRTGASKLFEEGLELMRGSMGYCGPLILGALAQYADDEADRERFLQEGERLLALGSIAFNAFYFNRSAIELMLDAHQYERALRYTNSMEEAFAAESIPLVQFFADRARALVAFGSGSRDVGIALELERLRNDALRAGVHAALERIDRALATMRAVYTERRGAENAEDSETTGKQSY
jgi:tetratricopeptide (TPR) repeat protein